MSEKRAYVTFSIKSEKLSSEKLSELMYPLTGKTQSQGEPISGRVGSRIAEFSSWALSTRGSTEGPDEAQALSVHLEWMASTLREKQDVLARLSGECDVELTCFLSADGTNCWFDISSGLLTTLATLGADLVFDVYAS